jgi:nitrogen fixation protein FixH
MRTIFALSLLMFCQLSAVAADAIWKISMEPVGKVKANTPAPLSIQVKDEKNKPVSGAEVEIVLTMVEMDHGEFKTPAKMTKPGVYEGSPNFFMVGKWNVTIKAKKGDATSTQVIPWEVKE